MKTKDVEKAVEKVRDEEKMANVDATLDELEATIIEEVASDMKDGDYVIGTGEVEIQLLRDQQKAMGDATNLGTVTSAPSTWDVQNLGNSWSSHYAGKSAKPKPKKRESGYDTYKRLRGGVQPPQMIPPEDMESLSPQASKIEKTIVNLERITADDNKHAKKTKEGINIPYRRKEKSPRGAPSPVFTKDMGYEFQSREEVFLFIGFADFLKIKHNLNPAKFNLRLKLLKDFHYIVVFKNKEFHARLVRGHVELNKFYNKIRMRVSLMDGLLNAGYQDKFFTEYLPSTNTLYNIDPDNANTINIDGHIVSKGVFECMVEDSYSNFMENVLYEDKLSI